ncbi:MAG TPA: AAA family ATPase [Azospirillaceae bacterium]|nr:AAA family ATPase [Azospirillaceae bacterium]HRQ79490.1 AAA family ATPase [Azospirillaceae bacterium]
MTVRYDDALPILIKICRDAQIDLETRDDVVVLRDATGRLGVAFETRRKNDGLVERLREALGAYALAEPVLPTALFPSLMQAGPKETFIKLSDDDGQWIRLLDRRIVGADWLADLAPQADRPPRLVFGSLKGGVGRTTALAVLAADLAQNGKRVLCVDLDLEAPGLGGMLLRDRPNDDRRPKFGALDYLVENGLGGVEDDELLDFIGVSHFVDGSIHVLPAVGRVTDEHPENMIGKLARGLIEDVGADGRQSVAMQMRAMVDRFVGYGDYDAVLIDARAGLAETTAGTWLGLGARKLLLFGVNQPQTFAGYAYVLAHLIQTLGAPDENAPTDWRSRLSFVHAKASGSGDGRTIFRGRLYDLCLTRLYDEESPEDDGAFTFGFDETGTEIPHDATLIEYHPDYDAFDPQADEALLRKDVYRGPYGAFLERAWEILGWERPE